MKSRKLIFLFLFGMPAIIFLICFHEDIYLFLKFNKMCAAIQSAGDCKVVNIVERNTDLNANMVLFNIQIKEASIENCLKAIGAANNVLSDPDDTLNKNEYLVRLSFRLKYSYIQGGIIIIPIIWKQAI